MKNFTETSANSVDSKSNQINPPRENYLQSYTLKQTNLNAFLFSTIFLIGGGIIIVYLITKKHKN